MEESISVSSCFFSSSAFASPAFAVSTAFAIFLSVVIYPRMSHMQGRLITPENGFRFHFQVCQPSIKTVHGPRIQSLRALQIPRNSDSPILQSLQSSLALHGRNFRSAKCFLADVLSQNFVFLHVLLHVCRGSLGERLHDLDAEDGFCSGGSCLIGKEISDVSCLGSFGN